jgi:hypothetical protein
MQIPEHLAKLRKVFKNYPPVDAVYLFGSSLTGNTHPESDVDLAVVTTDPTLSSRKLDLLTDLARIGFCRVDLVFFAEADIVLQFEIVRRNAVLYQKDNFDRGTIFSNTVRKYLDFSHYLQVQRTAYKQRILNGSI